MSSNNVLRMFLVGNSYKVCVPLPNKGPCWFTINKQETLNDFMNDLVLEDNQIKAIEAFCDREKSLEQIFKDGLFGLRLDGSMYTFNDWGISQDSSSETKNNNNFSTVEEVEESIQKKLFYLGQQTNVKLEKLKVELNILDKELENLENLENRIASKTMFRANAACGLGLSLLMTQWGVFYYSIYEVEWLGWDLMEPITYSIGQSTFVLGLFYYMRFRMEHTYDNMLKRFTDKRNLHFTKRLKLDSGRLQKLRKERERLFNKIQLIEDKKIMD